VVQWHSTAHILRFEDLDYPKLLPYLLCFHTRETSLANVSGEYSRLCITCLAVKTPDSCVVHVRFGPQTLVRVNVVAG
jgi:hypothetical protein